MLSDRIIFFSGRSFTIHYFGIYVAAAVFLFALAFFLWGYFRGRRVAPGRSIRRDELAIYFGRIADSLEMIQRVTAQVASRMDAEALNRDVLRREVERPDSSLRDEPRIEEPAPTLTEAKQKRSVEYSIFGR
ncbi:MAG TPA: hypothetical protein VLV89_04680 [Candidatus Acidoferrum sp.]|nr:hypothetical protein [Candidatus Acidoferrum sp.]